MNPPELPGLPAALGLVLFALPFLVLALRWTARRLSPGVAPAHRWSPREALAVIAAPFLVLLTFAVLANAGGSETVESGDDLGLAGLLGSQLLLGSAAALAVVFATRRPGGLESLGLARRPPPHAFVGVLLIYVPLFVCIFMGLGVVWKYVCQANGWDDQQEVLRLIQGFERHERLVAAIVAVGVAPLIEELVFRGFLQSLLAQVAGERSALVLASALFAGLHDIAVLPLLFALSLLLGWLQMRTRCLWVPCFAHALNNAVMLRFALAASPQ